MSALMESEEPLALASVVDVSTPVPKPTLTEPTVTQGTGMTARRGIATRVTWLLPTNRKEMPIAPPLLLLVHRFMPRTNL